MLPTHAELTTAHAAAGGRYTTLLDKAERTKVKAKIFKSKLVESETNFAKLKLEYTKQTESIQQLNDDLEAQGSAAATLQAEIASVSSANASELNQSKELFTKMRAKARTINEELKALKLKFQSHKKKCAKDLAATKAELARTNAANADELAAAQSALLEATVEKESLQQLFEEDSEKGGSELKHAKEQFAKMRVKAKLLQDQLKESRRKSSAMESEQTREAAVLQEKIEALESDIKACKAQNRAARKTAVAQNDAADSAHVELAAERDALLEANDTANTAHNALQAKAMALKPMAEDLAMVKAEKAQLQKDFDVIKSKYNDLGKGLKLQRKASNVAAEALADVTQEKDDAEARVKESKAKVNETKMKAKAIQDERNVLRQRVGLAEDAARTCKDGAASTAQELKSALAQIRRMAVEVATLERSCAEADGREGTATAELEMLRLEATTMRQTHTDAESGVEFAQTESDAALKQLQVQSAMKDDELQRLLVSLQSAEEAVEVSDAMVETLEEEMESLRRDRDEALGREASRASQDAVGDVHRVELLWTQTQLKQASVALAAAQTQLLEADAANATAAEDVRVEMQTQLDALVASNQTMADDVRAEMKNQLLQLEAANHTLAADFEAQLAALTAASDEVDAANLQVGEHSAELAATAGERDAAVAAKEDARAQLGLLTSRIVLLQDQIDAQAAALLGMQVAVAAAEDTPDLPGTPAPPTNRSPPPTPDAMDTLATPTTDVTPVTPTTADEPTSPGSDVTPFRVSLDTPRADNATPYLTPRGADYDDGPMNSQHGAPAANVDANARMSPWPKQVNVAGCPLQAASRICESCPPFICENKYCFFSDSSIRTCPFNQHSLTKRAQCRDCARSEMSLMCINRAERPTKKQTKPKNKCCVCRLQTM